MHFKTKINNSTFNYRFEATRLIRAIENKITDMIQIGEVSADNYGNKAHWHAPILAMNADVIQATFEKCMECGWMDMCQSHLKNSSSTLLLLIS